MTDTDPVQLELFATPGEYRRAAALARKHREHSPLLRAVVSALAGATVAAAFAFFEGTRLLSAGPLLFFGFVGSFTFVGSYVGEVVTWWHGCRRSEREIETLASAPLLSVRPEGLRVAHDQGAVEARWSAIDRAVETEDFLLFYAPGQSIYYVPRSSVTDGEWTRILRWVEGAGVRLRTLAGPGSRRPVGA